MEYKGKLYLSEEFMKKIICFGAGKIGTKVSSLLNGCGIGIYCYIDNNKDLWNKKKDGIPICSPDILSDQNDFEVLITCKNDEEIAMQLKVMGIDENCVFSVKSIWNFLLFLEKDEWSFKNTENPEFAKDRILFDLENGLVFGGVETWCFESQKTLKKIGYESKYICSDRVPVVIESEKKDTVFFKDFDDYNLKTESILKTIINYSAGNFIVNFAGANLYSACIAKRIFRENFRLIAVVLSDHPAYYEAYATLQNYFDYCFVISNKIKETLISYGFPAKKIRLIKWLKKCDDKLIRNYSKQDEPIKIGYAGRLSVIDKRADLLGEIILKTYERGINASFEIAGTGDFAAELQKIITVNKLDGKVKFLGFVDSSKISDFWRQQDIMIGCSDREGHSMTQMEAMSSGAVPIITDTSGARDDVSDGKNGYVVPVGDTDAIVEKVEFLFKNRQLLNEMGAKAHQHVKINNNENCILDLWEEVLLDAKN